MTASKRSAAAVAVVMAVGAAAAACSSGSKNDAGAGAGPGPVTSSGGSATSSASASPSPTPKPKPTYPPPQGAPGSWVTQVNRQGRAIVQTQTISAGGSTVVVMRMDGPSTRLILHAGYEDPGGAGWIAGPAISATERPTLVAAFNGGFRLGVGAGGFSVLGRTVGSIQPGLAAVVTYADGSSGLGAYGRDVPAAGKRVVTVRENLNLLVDNGQPAADIDAYAPWGATLGGGFAVARSGLGIDRYGNLMWAGSSYATPRAIATALIQSGAVRAMQLDINPQWVIGFAFPNATTQKVMLPSQSQGLGTYLNPYSRDFFSVVVRPPVATS